MSDNEHVNPADLLKAMLGGGSGILSPERFRETIGNAPAPVEYAQARVIGLVVRVQVRLEGGKKGEFTTMIEQGDFGTLQASLACGSEPSFAPDSSKTYTPLDVDKLRESGTVSPTPGGVTN